jgi:hypothetical protein
MVQPVDKSTAHRIPSLDVVVYLWRDTDPRRVFLPAHVSTLARAFRRTLTLPHRLVCITDEPAGAFTDGVVVLPTPPGAARLARFRNPEGSRFPSSYRRLWTFSREAQGVLAEWVLGLDIDAVPLQDLAPLVNPPRADFVGWRPLARWGNAARVGGGMYLLRTGTHPEVYTDFDGAPAIAAARRAGFRGSDQAWLSFKLGRTCQVWNGSSGLYSIRDLADGRRPLPADARLVQFNGPTKPWDSPLPWVKQFWN